LFADYGLMLIGDSSCLMSLDPDEISSVTGMSAMNLASDGYHTLDLQADMLDLYLRRHASPKMIILHSSPMAYRDWTDFTRMKAKRDEARLWVRTLSTGRPEISLQDFNLSLTSLTRKLNVFRHQLSCDLEALTLQFRSEKRAILPRTPKSATSLIAGMASCATHLLRSLTLSSTSCPASLGSCPRC
jgi:hypothetical protein